VTMTPHHPRWDEFCERLAGPENGANAIDACAHDHTAAIATLFAMGFSEDDVTASLDYFTAHGGHCDCEILFNLDGEAFSES
jgi:hypothetical protein